MKEKVPERGRREEEGPVERRNRKNKSFTMEQSMSSCYLYQLHFACWLLWQPLALSISTQRKVAICKFMLHGERNRFMGDFILKPNKI